MNFESYEHDDFEGDFEEESTPTPADLSFAPEHAKYLTDRAVDLDLAKAFGLRSVSPQEAQMALGRSWPLPAEGRYLLIPHSPFGYNRVRVIPKIEGLGKDLAPAKQEVPVFIADDGQGPLVVVESAPKALALYSHGLRAVGLAGVATTLVRTSDQAKGDAPELNNYWNAVQLEGREVRVVFDSNTHKPAVATAEARLVIALRNRGAKVRVARLPQAPDGSEQGPDDFLRNVGFEAFQKVLADTHEPTDQGLKKALRAASRKFKATPLPHAVSQKKTVDDWLWPGFIPSGSPAAIVGRGGSGKSTLTTLLISRFVTGQPMPFCGQGQAPGNALLLAFEDDEKYILARSLAAGAGEQAGRIFTVGLQDEDDWSSRIQLPRDWSEVADLVEETQSKVVVIDPVASFLEHRLNPDKFVDVRAFTDGAKPICKELGATVIFVHHLNKSGDTSGSHAWDDAVRIVLSLTNHPHDEDLRLLRFKKVNHVKKQPPFVFSMDEAEVIIEGQARTTNHLVPVGQSELSEDELGGEQASGPMSVTSEVIDLLREILEAGPKSRKDVFQEVKAVVAATPRTIERAATKLGVQKLKQTADGKVVGSIWSLPGSDPDLQPGGEC